MYSYIYTVVLRQVTNIFRTVINSHISHGEVPPPSAKFHAAGFISASNRPAPLAGHPLGGSDLAVRGMVFSTLSLGKGLGKVGGLEAWRLVTRVWGWGGHATWNRARGQKLPATVFFPLDSQKTTRKKEKEGKKEGKKEGRKRGRKERKNEL